MMLVVLVACSNLNDRVFNDEGGPRHATGVWDGWVGDTASDSGGGSGDTGSAASGDAPTISDVSLAFGGDEESPVVEGTISYTDDQDDLVGGTVNLMYAVGDTTPTYDNRQVVAEEDWDDPLNQASYQGAGTIYFEIADADPRQDFTVTDVTLEDEAGHESGGVDADVLEAEQ